MRTNEERITALHERAGKLSRERRRRQFAAVCAASAAVCIGLLIGLACLIPKTVENPTVEYAKNSLNASIFSGSNMLGFIVIVILAFLLGITVTVFCFRLKKWMDKKPPENPE